MQRIDLNVSIVDKLGQEGRCHTMNIVRHGFLALGRLLTRDGSNVPACN